MLHPVSDMAIRDAPLEKLMAREAQLQARLEGLPFHKDQDRDQQLERSVKSCKLLLGISQEYDITNETSGKKTWVIMETVPLISQEL